MVFASKKPQLVYAVQFKDDSTETLSRIYNFFDQERDLRLSYKDVKNPKLKIQVRYDTTIVASIGDYIVKNDNGFHVSTAAYFESEYQPYEEEGK